LTAVVEVDVAVDVEPIVDLDFDHRSRFFDEDLKTIGGSTYKVENESTFAAAVHVDVLRQRQGQPQRLCKDRSVPRDSGAGNGSGARHRGEVPS
jgi:hypothetical protein